MLGALGRVALLSLKQRLFAPVRTRTGAGEAEVPLPGPLFERTVAPAAARSRGRLRARHGRRSRPRTRTRSRRIFFRSGPSRSQRARWRAFPTRSSPWSTAAARSSACAPCPWASRSSCARSSNEIDDDGRRAVLKQHVVTGTKSDPDALITDFYAIVPLGRRGKDRSAGKPKEKAPSEKPTVPAGVTKLATWDLPKSTGLDFAKLTGDFNPIHWIGPYARASGFPNVILHGFGTMARTYEGLVKHVFGGRPGALKTLDVRFTKPLVLPASVGLFRDAGAVYVGHAPGSQAYSDRFFRGRRRLAVSGNHAIRRDSIRGETTMNDMLLRIAERPVARKLLESSGLPIPMPEPLVRVEGAYAERPLDGKHVARGRRAGTSAQPERARGGDQRDAGEHGARVLPKRRRRPTRICTRSSSTRRALDSPAALRGALRLFPCLDRPPGAFGRVVVLGRAAEEARSGSEAAARAALEGFMRSVAKEIGRKGATANLVFVRAGAEPRAKAFSGSCSRRVGVRDGAAVRRDRSDVAARARRAFPWARSLEGKVALVTGAARGIGAATARALAAEGAHVVCLDRPADDAAAQRRSRGDRRHRRCSPT